MAMGLERKLGLQPPGVRLRGVEPPRPEGSGAMTETLVPIGCLLVSFLRLLVQFAKPSQPIEAPLPRELHRRQSQLAPAAAAKLRKSWMCGPARPAQAIVRSRQVLPR